MKSRSKISCEPGPSTSVICDSIFVGSVLGDRLPAIRIHWWSMDSSLARLIYNATAGDEEGEN